MKRTLALLGASILCFVGLGVHALAQTPESERTLVTDPDVLASMGFSRDATNVYMAKNMTKPVEPQAPSDWGLGFHFTPVSPKSFIGRQNTPGAEWFYDLGPIPDTNLALSRSGPEDFADSPIQLPTGVIIAANRWWANDTNAAEDIAIFVFEQCHPGFAPGAETVTTIASSSPATTGSGGYQSGVLAGSGTTVNNQDCNYVARVRFDATTGLTFQKLRVQWNRQVSPAPAVATFLDVPTTHSQFQFIEALVAAGITAGCGGGNYCPANNLTRGQMAVFLSLALGLYFP
jgi:hypothetical protein